MAIMIAELLSLGYIGITTKGLFYSLPTAPISASTENQKISRRSIIHPYFGFIIPSGKTVESVIVPNGRIRFMTDNFDPLPTMQRTKLSYPKWSRIPGAVLTKRMTCYMLNTACVFHTKYSSWNRRKSLRYYYI